jgi:dihydrofolate reductase
MWWAPVATGPGSIFLSTFEATPIKPMDRERKIIVYIAVSADGYIARTDGSVEWLHKNKTPSDYGMAAFHKSIDAIIWGRRTFDEAVQRLGGKIRAFSDPKSKITNFVITHRAEENLPGLEFVSEPIEAFAKRLRELPGKNIWMMGGGKVIASFLDAGQIDEFMVHVIPTFIGEGIPLISPESRSVDLELIDTKSWPDGVVKLHYRVLPQSKETGKGKKG